MIPKKSKVLILGAAGRDFHVFNTCFRDNEDYEVVAFTATQIPDIDDRCYPKELAGKLYPNGIKIHAESEFSELIEKLQVDEVIMAYSDVKHTHVMHLASQVLAAGASFKILGPKQTQIKSRKPVIAIVSSRTGAGKSQATRAVMKILREDFGKKVVAIRHPMPYGDLAKQAVQRFASIEDLQKHSCTIEECEEYEPHVSIGNVIYAGVDYGAILKQAEEESDIILWDGGNNDFSFFVPDLCICVVDALRPGHEVTYHPGETNLRAADIIVINKIDSANLDDLNQIRKTISQVNPKAQVIECASPIFVTNPEIIKGKRVLCVEDGPTLSHGEMKFGAAVVAANRFGATTIVDPRPFLVGKLKDTFKKYPEIGCLLPAMGYGDEQTKDLEKTINKVDCDVVVIATPIDLNRIIKIDKKSTRVTYELQEIGKPDLKDALKEFLQ